MSVTLVYFAWVRERIGLERETIDLESPQSLSALLDRLVATSDGHARALRDRERIRAALNEEFVGWDATVRSGDEVALFPPMTGGAGREICPGG